MIVDVFKQNIMGENNEFSNDKCSIIYLLFLIILMPIRKYILIIFEIHITLYPK